MKKNLAVLLALLMLINPVLPVRQSAVAFAEEAVGELAFEIEETPEVSEEEAPQEESVEEFTIEFEETEEEVLIEETEEEPLMELTEEAGTEAEGSGLPQTAEELAEALGDASVAELAERIGTTEETLAVMTAAEIEELYQSLTTRTYGLAKAADEYIVNGSVLAAYNGMAEVVEIPDNLGITAIGESAFENKTFITAVKIPDGVVSVGARAFRGCSALETVILPETVETIGEEAFAGCEAMETFTLPESVSSMGEDAFNGAPVTILVYKDSASADYCVSYLAKQGVLYKSVDDAEVFSVDAAQVLLDTGAPQAIFTVKTTQATTSVKMYAEAGGAILTVNSGWQDVGGDRVWTVKYTFTNDGTRTMHFTAVSGSTESAKVACPITLKGAQVKTAAFNPTTATAGVAAAIKVTTSSAAQYLHMYAENGGLIKVWPAAGNSTAGGGIRTWNISYAFINPGTRTMTFKASLDGSTVKNGVAAKVTVQTAGLPTVSSAAANRSVVPAGTFLTFTVKTSTNAKYLTLCSEGGAAVKTWTADSSNTADAGGVRTWTLQYAFTGTGNRSISFKASADGNSYGASKGVSVKVVGKLDVLSAAASASSATVKETLTYTIKTGTSVNTLSLYAGTYLVKSWTAAGNSADADGIRTWTLKYAIGGAGNRTITFKGSADGKTYGAGVSLNIVVANLPTVSSAAVDHTVIPAGAYLTFTVKTSTNAKYLTLCGETGSAVKTWTADGSNTVDASGVRTWTLQYAFISTGNRSISFKASADKINYGASKGISVKVIGKLDVLSAQTSATEVAAGVPLTYTVVTGTSVSSVSLYAEGNYLVKTWPASGNSTDEGGLRTWKLQYAIGGTGNRTITFKGTADGKTYGAGVALNIKVMPKTSVISAEVSIDPATIKQPVIFTVKTGTSVNYLNMYSGTSSFVKGWEAKGNSVDENGVRTWTLEYAIGGAGNRVLTFKGSSDGKTFGEGVQITVKVLTLPAVTAAAFTSATAETGTAAEVTATTPEHAQYLHMFLENGSLYRTWAADEYSTVENGVRTWTVSHAFSNAGTRTMTFKASADNANYGTGVSATVTIVKPSGIVYTAINDTTCEVTGYTGTDSAVVIPATALNGRTVVAIAENAFKGNTTIKSLTLPGTVENVGASAFEGCSALEKVTGGDSIQVIGKAAFKNCTSLSTWN